VSGYGMNFNSWSYLTVHLHLSGDLQIIMIDSASPGLTEYRVHVFELIKE